MNQASSRSKGVHMVKRLEWVELHDALRSVRDRLMAHEEHDAVDALNTVIHNLELHPVTADYDSGYKAGVAAGRALEVARFAAEDASRQREREIEANLHTVSDAQSS